MRDRVDYYREQVYNNIDAIERRGAHLLQGDDLGYYNALKGTMHWVSSLDDHTHDAASYKRRQYMQVKFRLDEIIDNMEMDNDD